MPEAVCIENDRVTIFHEQCLELLDSFVPAFPFE